MTLLLLGCFTAEPPAAPAWRDHPVVYTHHARERMDCRQVTEDEVLAVLKDGVLDPSRTRNDGECPSVALEATSADGQELRVVFAQCEGENRVVTAIDLGADHGCD